MNFELTEIRTYYDEKLLRYFQVEEGHVLRFHGEFVWRAIDAAIDGVRRKIAVILDISAETIFPLQIETARYDFVDQCIILETQFSIPDRFERVTACATLRADFSDPGVGLGKCPTLSNPSAVSIDLIAGTCIPYCEQSISP